MQALLGLDLFRLITFQHGRRRHVTRAAARRQRREFNRVCFYLFLVFTLKPRVLLSSKLRATSALSLLLNVSIKF
jgi:hypothetical protein